MFQRTTLKSLLEWEKPLESGIVAGSLIGVIMIFGIMNYTVLTFVCRCLQALMIGFAAAAYLGKPFANREQLVARARQLHEALLPTLWAALEAVARIVTWENRTTTLEVLVGSFVLASLGNFFSDLTLMFLLTVGFFAVPVAYAHHKAIVDVYLVQCKQMLDALIQQGAEQMRKAAESLSPHRSADARKKSE